MDCYFEGCENGIRKEWSFPSRVDETTNYLTTTLTFRKDLCQTHYDLISKIIDNLEIDIEDQDTCRDCW